MSLYIDILSQSFKERRTTLYESFGPMTVYFLLLLAVIYRCIYTLNVEGSFCAVLLCLNTRLPERRLHEEGRPASRHNRLHHCGVLEAVAVPG
jgi:hypothetical protein